MLSLLALIMATLLLLLGLGGAFLPILPGPPLSFLGLFLLAFLRNFSPPLTPRLLITMLIVTVGVTFIDYFLPLIGAKKYGASKWGILGAIGGMILGAFLSPLGIFLGAFMGAVGVEWMLSKTVTQALRSGWGILIGSFLGTILKLGVSGVMAYYFFAALFQ